MGKPDLSLLFRDLTQLGLPKSQFSLVSDETAYNYNPDRYNFYMQLLDDVADPKQKIASKVFGVLARTRRQHERIKEKIDSIANAINYLKTTYTKPAQIGQPREYGELAVLKDDLNNPLRGVPIVGKDYEFDTDFEKAPTTEIPKAFIKEDDKIKQLISEEIAFKETKVAAEAAAKAATAEAAAKAATAEADGTINPTLKKIATEKADKAANVALAEAAKAAEAAEAAEAAAAEALKKEQGGGSWYGDKVKELKQIEGTEFKSKRQKEMAEDDVLLEYKNHFIYSPENLNVTYTDRLIFIGITFMFRAIALFMIDWGINTRIIKGFQSGFFYYFGIYILFFMIWVLLVNFRKDNVTIGMLFYYINANYDRSVWKRIILHLVMQLFILPIPIIIKDTSQKDTPENDTFDKRERMMSTLSMFTFIIWVLTSIIALRA